MGYIGVMNGNEKENGSCYLGFIGFRDIGLYRDYTGIVEKKVETTIWFLGLGILFNQE